MGSFPLISHEQGWSVAFGLGCIMLLHVCKCNENM